VFKCQLSDSPKIRRREAIRIRDPHWLKPDSTPF
jgi:hypothetical protein